LFLSFPSWDSVPILGEPRAESTPQRENICAFQLWQREFSYAIHLIRVSTIDKTSDKLSVTPALSRWE
jgi:hypothetical protein